MEDKKQENRLKILITKIAVDADNMEVVNEIVVGLSVECNVVIKSVRRWMNNTSQPTSSDLKKIIIYLNKYDSSISFNDFFGTGVTPIAVSRKLQLVK